MNVLFIDDDSSINRYHEIVLEEAALDKGVSLQFNNDPIKTISYLKALKSSQFPQLIFLDINMPKMNGWEFLDKYHTENLSKDIAFVILTTSKNPSYEVKASKIEVVKGYHIKPLDEVYFRELVEEYF